MQTLNRPFLFFSVLALVAASTLALSGAFAGDEVTPTSAAPTAAADAPAEKAEAPSTKTPSPVHTLMGWMATAVVGDMESPCPSCPKAESAWRSWFDGGKDVPLAGLRDRLVSDGWTADRYIGYFQAMSKDHAKASGECGDCCGDCDSKSDCSDCPSKGDCGDCDGCPSKGASSDKSCGGCPDSKDAEPKPQGTAAK